MMHEDLASEQVASHDGEIFKIRVNVMSLCYERGRQKQGEREIGEVYGLRIIRRVVDER